MTAYRVANLAKIKKAKVVRLSRSKAAETEKLLIQTRKRYEKLLFENFTYFFFKHFRITIFGSAAVKEDEEYFKFVEKMTRKLGEEIQVDIVTGGGDGLMLAANQGLREAQVELQKKHKKVHCKNFGIRVDLPHESGEDNKVDMPEKVWNFSTRLEEFIRSSNGIYLAPGGFGTDLEAAMFIQLKQRWRIEEDFPIIAHPFWKPIFEQENQIFFDDQIKNGHTPLIDKQDKKLVYYTDEISEIIKIFKKHYLKWEKLKKKVKWED